MDATSGEMEKELAFQSKRAARIGTVVATPDRIFERYRRSPLPWIFPKEMLFRSLGPIEGKEILDIGCGEGELSTQLAKLGARVTGIDISPELVEVAKQRAVADQVQDRTTFLVWDILDKPLPKERFDLLTCSEVLHHVDIPAFLPVVWSTVKSGGKAVMIEPLGLSPTMRKLRRYVPVHTDASPGEHPLTRQEFNLILSTLGGARVTYYELFARLHAFFRRGHRLERVLLVALGRIDRLLLGLFPPLQKYAGTVVIVAQKGSRTQGRR